MNGKESQLPPMLVEKNFPSCLCFVSTSFIGLQILFQRVPRDHSSFCDVTLPTEVWMIAINAGIAGGFVLSLCNQTTAMLSISREERCLHYIPIAINGMVLYSHVYNLVNFGSNVCVDSLGVISSLNVWPIRLVYLPTLVYVAFAYDFKPNLSIAEIVYVVGGFLFISIEFLLNLKPSRTLSVAMIIVCGIYVLLYCTHHVHHLRKSNSVIVANDNIVAQMKTLSTKSMKSDLLSILCVYFVVHFVFYALSASQQINRNQAFIIIGLIDAITIFSFSQSIVAAHLKLKDYARDCVLAEQRGNEAKRSYLRYVFHDVRVPLNSISMGLNLMEALPNLSKSDLDIFRMMQEACEFMSNTLNDVLSMEKIEAGAMTIDLTAFSLSDMVKHVILSVQGQARGKDLRITIVSSHDVPSRVLGGEMVDYRSVSGSQHLKVVIEYNHFRAMIRLYN